MAQPSRLEQLQARLGKKAAAVSRVLTSADGEVLMKALEEEFFNGPLIGDTPEKTAFNVGAREVVTYLRALIAFHNKEQSNARPDPLA